MQLTIEHLAAYNFKTAFHVEDIESKEYEELYVNAIDLEDELSIIGATQFHFEDLGKTVDGTMCKPYLRPLSQLSQEIEHNGEIFVPIGKLQLMNDAIDSFDLSFGQFYVENYSAQIMVYVDVLDMQYSVVAKLFEWHFDVFGLIEQGLALPIQ